MIFGQELSRSMKCALRKVKRELHLGMVSRSSHFLLMAQLSVQLMVADI